MRDGRREGSLLAVIDRTTTAMGSRLLADWVAAPLTDRDGDRSATGRRRGVDSARARLRSELRDSTERESTISSGLLARVATGRASPRDLSFIGRTLASLPPIKELLHGRSSSLLDSNWMIASRSLPRSACSSSTPRWSTNVR